MPRGQVTCAARPAVEQRRDGLRARRHRVEVDRHHAGEHVLGDARHRRAAGARSVARLRALVWLSDRLVGAMNTSHAASAAATGARRLGAVGGALVHDDQDGVGAGRCRLLPAAPRRSPASAGSTTTTTSSPGWTRQAAPDHGAGRRGQGRSSRAHHKPAAFPARLRPFQRKASEGGTGPPRAAAAAGRKENDRAEDNRPPVLCVGRAVA